MDRFDESKLDCSFHWDKWPKSAFNSVQFSSVTQPCLTLCNPMDCSTPGLHVHRQLPEFAQTHIHWVGDAIQPSHPLSSPSSPAFNLSQHQGLFKWVSFSHQVAKVLECQLQHQSFQWIFRTDFLRDGLVGSSYNPRDSQESSPIPQFKSINSSALSLLYGPTLCDPMDCSMPVFPVLHHLPEFAQAHVHWFYLMDSSCPSNHLILCPLLLLPSMFLSIRVFSNESALCIRWPKYWSFSFSIRPSSEHPGLMSFRMDWLDLLAVHGTLKSLLQHHNSKASVLCSAFFIVQFSHAYVTTGKTIALTRWTFVGKVCIRVKFNISSVLQSLNTELDTIFTKLVSPRSENLWSTLERDGPLTISKVISAASHQPISQGFWNTVHSGRSPCGPSCSADGQSSCKHARAPNTLPLAEWWTVFVSSTPK